MNIKHIQLLFALAFPIIALGTFTGYKVYQRNSGVEVTIPITGYDPRDLLAGHYLTYRLKFDENICAGKGWGEEPVFMCVVEQADGLSSSEVPAIDAPGNEACSAVIKGQCEGRFEAGVERFYVPEEYSATLDSIVRGWGENRNRAKLLINVGRDGHAAVKDLLIDDLPLKDYLDTVKD